MNRSGRRLALAIGIAATLTGCSQGFARLNGVLVGDSLTARPAQAEEKGRVVVTRGSAGTQGRRGMQIQKGDGLTTTEDGVGLIVLSDGYEVIVDPASEITIENPSIFVRAGRVIVKKVKRIKEALTVRTELGAAVVEGTEFVFEVDPDRSVTIAVLEGAVKVYPRAAAWTDTTRYVAGERVTFDSLQITKLAPLASPAIAALRRRIQLIEGASPAVKPFWQSPLFIVPVVAAGVVAGVLLLDSPEQPTDILRDGTVTVDLPF